MIDPANRKDGIMNVAVSGNRMARVAQVISASEGRKVIDAAGLPPGLIDLLAHVYGSEGSLFPDDTSLIAGAEADIAVFALRTGVFAFADSWHVKRLGTKRLECVLTVRDGKLVFDRDGLGFPLLPDHRRLWGDPVKTAP